MDVMEYLSRPGEITARIRNRSEKIAALRTVAVKTTPTLSPASGGAAHSDGHRMEDLLAKIDSLERENADDRELLAQVTLEILDALDTIPNDFQRSVLRLSFVEMKRPKEICKKLFISESYLKKLRKQGKEALAGRCL